ncbi:hypothetical protein ZWY2020_028837 [Hordeum vulgare]|nr:hypothetical protein ZWY2020_028837 [Hordeum vulgare]
MKKVFSRFDTDGDGRISRSELAAVSRAIAPPYQEVGGSTGYITMKDMVVTGMPIKIVGVAALTVLP